MEINKNILYSKELNSNEKMILFLLTSESGKKLNSQFFIDYLGCSKKELELSFNNLVSKGYLSLENDSSKIKKDGKSYDKVSLEEFDVKKYENDIERLYEIIDDPINDRQARIILNMAKNDLSLIEENYKKASNSQFSDKIGILIKELQNKKFEVKKDSESKNKKSQINYKSISKLKNYQK